MTRNRGLSGRRAAMCGWLQIATLWHNRRNAVELPGLLKNGKIGALTLLASDFCRNHRKELDEWFRGEPAAYPVSRIGAARSHCKVVCIDFTDGAPERAGLDRASGKKECARFDKTLSVG